VRKATADDVSGIAQSLAKAFYDDPVTEWWLPDESRRMRQAQRIFESIFLKRICLPHDETYTTEEVVVGALWMPPGKWQLGLIENLRLLPFMAAVWGRGLPRVMRSLGYLDSKHPHELHYYLRILGVEPEWQGKGMGRPHATDPRALRQREIPRLSSGNNTAQLRTLPAQRVRGHRGDRAARRRPAPLANVARTRDLTPRDQSDSYKQRAGAPPKRKGGQSMSVEEKKQDNEGTRCDKGRGLRREDGRGAQRRDACPDDEHRSPDKAVRRDGGPSALDQRGYRLRGKP
jgi:GNAT superfamily N-acetyltransferase